MRSAVQVRPPRPASLLIRRRGVPPPVKRPVPMPTPPGGSISSEIAPLAGGSGGGFTRQNLPAKIGVTTTVPRVYRREAKPWYAGGDGGARPRSERRGARAE